MQLCFECMLDDVCLPLPLTHTQHMHPPPLLSSAEPERSYSPPPTHPRQTTASLARLVRSIIIIIVLQLVVVLYYTAEQWAKEGSFIETKSCTGTRQEETSPPRVSAVLHWSGQPERCMHGSACVHAWVCMCTCMQTHANVHASHVRL